MTSPTPKNLTLLLLMWILTTAVEGNAGVHYATSAPVVLCSKKNKGSSACVPDDDALEPSMTPAPLARPDRQTTAPSAAPRGAGTLSPVSGGTITPVGNATDPSEPFAPSPSESTAPSPSEPTTFEHSGVPTPSEPTTPTPSEPTLTDPAPSEPTPTDHTPSEPTTPVPTPLNPSSPEDSPMVSQQSAECVTVNGVYGSLAGDPLVVTWSYAVEVNESMSEADFNNNVLPDLETDFNDALVPSLFEVVACSVAGRQRRLSMIAVGRRRLAAPLVGMSARPSDSVEPDIECTGTYCFGVMGMLTLFIDNSGRAMQESHTTIVRDDLKASMNAGKFDGRGQIVRVTYIEDDNGGASGIANDGDRESPSDTGVNGKLVGLVVGVGGAFLLISVAAAVILRRRRNAGHSQLIPEADGSTATS